MEYEIKCDFPTVGNIFVQLSPLNLIDKLLRLTTHIIVTVHRQIEKNEKQPKKKALRPQNHWDH